MSNEKPILFSTPMVKAIIDGRKTKTRRVIKGMGNKMHYGRLLGDWGLSDPPELRDGVLYWKLQTDVDDDRVFEQKCPWKVGQILWVKETWALENVNNKDVYIYKADGWDRSGLKWKSSRFMPRKAARLFLKVKSIRVERLQEITEEDAMAEGIRGWTKDGNLYKYGHIEPGDEGCTPWKDMQRTAKEAFCNLWDNINAKRDYGWDVNPWVWVIEFERVEEPEC